MSAPTLSRVIFFPTEVTSRIFGFLANLGSNGAFEFISRKMWAVGHGAFLLGWIAVAGFCTVVALQSTQSVLAAIISVPVFLGVGQFIAVRLTDQSEQIVANSPTRVTGTVVFQLLGAVLLVTGLISWAGSVFLGTSSITTGDKAGDGLGVGVLAIGFGTVGGCTLVSVGLLFFSPKTLNLEVDPSASAGSDGLALIGTLIKALLATSRFAVGLYSILGGIAAAVALMWQIIDSKAGVSNLALGVGLSWLLTASIYPLVAYVSAALYYVVVDALVGLISLSRDRAH